jgi:hypothetical protein
MPRIVQRRRRKSVKRKMKREPARFVITLRGPWVRRRWRREVDFVGMSRLSGSEAFWMWVGREEVETDEEELMLLGVISPVGC